MGFINSLKICFKKYVLISGRASKSEFWYFALFFYAVIGIIIFIAYQDYKIESSNRTGIAAFSSHDTLALQFVEKTF